MYCPAGDFYIDPWGPVERALITHAHSDHARPGSRRYLTARDGEALLRARLGGEATIEGVGYGERLNMNGAAVSFHPAGHILGSAQIRIERGGEVCVVSGDYKVAPDATCAAFEPQRCHTFVTESTFALPIYRWPAEAEIAREIEGWWRGNREAGLNSVLYAHPLGKAQRVLAAIDASIGPIAAHGAVEKYSAIYRARGIAIPAMMEAKPRDGALVLAPPSAMGSPWLKRFGAISTAMASGWMRIRGTRRRRSLDRGFALSDHADWPGLLAAIEATGAETVWAMHGYRAPTGAVARGAWEARGNAGDALRSGRRRGMKAFAELYAALDGTTKTNGKIAALTRYLSQAPAEDAVWAISFLIGRRPKRLLPSRRLAEWAIAEAGVPEWLFGECYHAVGDFAETIALLLPPAARSSDLPLHVWVEERLLPMREASDEQRRAHLTAAWREMDEGQRFAWNKLITGEFRVGVSQSLVVRAIAETSGAAPETIAHRLMGEWQPTADFWRQLTAADSRDADVSRPYPFCLAYPLEGAVEDLGDRREWQVEWKWDGIRAQLIRRGWKTWLWSRGEELITDRFPEIEAVGALLPEGTAIDGEVMPWKNGAPLAFAQMQRRIGRKSLGAKILSDVPAALVAYDLLELRGEDVRERPLEWRRAQLEAIAPPDSALVLSPVVEAPTWEELRTLRGESRARKVEGLMLKRLNSPYRVGRRRGDWWKWKIEPYSVDAVLIYAQPGNGRRASLFTDYTFGVWDDGKLTPFAKAYSGLSDEEIREVDAFVRRNTLEQFGPVRHVKPELVFELAFEGIQKSSRHRSGIAVRFPRMARWRKDKTADQADSIETIRALLNAAG